MAPCLLPTERVWHVEKEYAWLDWICFWRILSLAAEFNIMSRSGKSVFIKLSFGNSLLKFNKPRIMPPKKPNAFLKSNLFVNTWSIWCILPWLNFSQEATLRKVWLIVSPTKYILYPAIFNHPTVILLATVYIANSSHPDKYLHIKSSPDLSDVTPNMFHNRVCCTCKCIEIVIHICLIQKTLIRTKKCSLLSGRKK